MTAYVDSGDHLKACMNLLRDDRKMVQYEGFHVFKVCLPNTERRKPWRARYSSKPLIGLCCQPEQVNSRAKNLDK